MLTPWEASLSSGRWAARSASALPGAEAAPRTPALLGESSARRWIGAELMAYAAQTAVLTFVGAFFIERQGVGETAAGWLLAVGAAATSRPPREAADSRPEFRSGRW